MSKRKIIPLAAALAICAALLIWSEAPRSFSYASGIDPAEIVAVDIYLLAVEAENSWWTTLPPDDPAFTALWDKLDSEKYYPLVTENVPKALHMPGGGHGIHLDYEVNLFFRSRGEPPHHISIDGWEGIQMGRWFYRTSGGLAFQQELLDLLLAQEDMLTPLPET